MNEVKGKSVINILNDLTFDSRIKMIAYGMKIGN